MVNPAVSEQDNEPRGPIPDPLSTVASGLKTITGGGITKDEPTGTDQMFRAEDGAIKSIQPAAAKSIEQQMQPLSQ